MSRHALRARDYLSHMLDAVRRIQQYTQDQSRTDFLSNQLLQDGVARNLEILGEASRKLLETLPTGPSLFPNIPFAAIYGMRNQLSHGYFTVEWETVWTTIERDIPELAAELQKAIEQLSKACD